MDESLEECAVRECREETGVTIAKERLRFGGINSAPKDNQRQKVSVTYVAELDDCQPTFADGDEISEVRWIKDVDSLDWAFPSQKALIKSIINTNTFISSLRLDTEEGIDIRADQSHNILTVDNDE